MTPTQDLACFDLSFFLDYLLVGGFNPVEKYEFVSWDDYSIPNMMENHKIHVPNHKSVYVFQMLCIT